MWAEAVCTMLQPCILICHNSLTTYVCPAASLRVNLRAPQAPRAAITSSVASPVFGVGSEAWPVTRVRKVRSQLGAVSSATNGYSVDVVKDFDGNYGNGKQAVVSEVSCVLCAPLAIPRALNIVLSPHWSLL